MCIKILSVVKLLPHKTSCCVFFVRKLLATTRKLERDVYLAQRNYERYEIILNARCVYIYA